MIDGITYHPNFVKDDDSLFADLMKIVDWDSRMSARKTASYGTAYNYSQMSYPARPFLNHLSAIAADIHITLGFEPNNCLINLYADGNSAMGYHSDQVDILADGTGVVIVSLGAARTLRFRSIADKQSFADFKLEPGSLFYMSQQVQHLWQHAIPKTPASGMRMSLTFRKIKIGL